MLASKERCHDRRISWRNYVAWCACALMSMSFKTDYFVFFCLWQYRGISLIWPKWKFVLFFVFVCLWNDKLFVCLFLYRPNLRTNKSYHDYMIISVCDAETNVAKFREIRCRKQRFFQQTSDTIITWSSYVYDR